MSRVTLLTNLTSLLAYPCTTFGEGFFWCFSYGLYFGLPFLMFMAFVVCRKSFFQISLCLPNFSMLFRRALNFENIIVHGLYNFNHHNWPKQRRECILLWWIMGLTPLKWGHIWLFCFATMLLFICWIFTFALFFGALTIAPSMSRQHITATSLISDNVDILDTRIWNAFVVDFLGRYDAYWCF